MCLLKIKSKITDTEQIIYYFFDSLVYSIYVTFKYQMFVYMLNMCVYILFL